MVGDHSAVGGVAVATGESLTRMSTSRVRAAAPNTPAAANVAITTFFENMRTLPALGVPAFTSRAPSLTNVAQANAGGANQAVEGCREPVACSASFHSTFHIAGDTRGRHATPRDTMWLMLLNFPNGVVG